MERRVDADVIDAGRQEHDTPTGRGSGIQRGLDAGLLVFMAVSLGISLWQVRLALCRVEMTADSITLRAPLARPSTFAVKGTASGPGTE